MDEENSFSNSEAVRYALDHLARQLGSQPERDAALEERLDRIAPFQRVNVSLRTHGRLRGSMSAPGGTFGEQLRKAAFQAAVDRRFDAPISAVELPSVDVEIWLQTSNELVPPEELTTEAVIAWGIQGIEIRAEGRSAYYKPSVPLTSGKDTLEALLSSLCKKAGLAKDRWRAPAASVFRTSWRRVSDREPGDIEASPLERLTATTVAGWRRETAAYLLASRQATGDFTYLYDPIRDREIFDKPSRVRSAGCLYSLSAYLDSVGGEVTEAELQGIVSLAQAQVSWTRPLPGGGLAVPDSRASEPPKTGATALLALALGGRELFARFEPTYSQLCHTIDEAQQPDGRFLTHLGVPTENKRSSEFFSGQVLLTLVQRAAKGDGDALVRVERAFLPYREQFAKAPTTAFVGWHADVWTRMAALTGKDEYADFAFVQVDWLLQIQVLASRQPIYVGGFSAKGGLPKYSSVVFLEAVVRAYKLADQLGLRERAFRYRQAVVRGLKFCRLLRLGESRADWFPNPERSRGGIGLSPLDLRVRCDVPQHFLTLCCLLLELPELFAEDGG